MQSEIGTGESSDRAAEFITNARTPDELRDIITAKYAIIGSVFGCGYTAQELLFVA